MEVRLIDANALVRAIIAERDKIPLEVVERYSFGVPSPYKHGQSMRGGIRKALRCVEEAPTLDYEPVRHGEWIENDTPFTRQRRCSVCGHNDNPKTAIKGKFCWYCGAKMDVEVK